MNKAVKRYSAVCLLALAPAVTLANIIPTLNSVTGTGPYTWTYGLTLSSDQDAHSGTAPASTPVPHDNDTFGAFLTIYDFGGYIDGSCVGPAGWVCTAQNVGFTPDDVLPFDRSFVTNLTWAYTTGPTIAGTVGGHELGVFSARSTFNETSLIMYTARGTKNNGLSSGTIADNIGNTTGPIPTAVTEPASLVLMGLGMGFLGMLRRMKRSG